MQSEKERRSTVLNQCWTSSENNCDKNISRVKLNEAVFMM